MDFLFHCLCCPWPASPSYLKEASEDLSFTVLVFHGAVINSFHGQRTTTTKKYEFDFYIHLYYNTMQENIRHMISAAVFVVGAAVTIVVIVLFLLFLFLFSVSMVKTNCT